MRVSGTGALRMGYKCQLAGPDRPSMNHAAHDLAMERLRSYVAELERETPRNWLLTALGVLSWTNTQQWKRDASRAETTMIRRACKEARDCLTKKPPDIAGARARLAWLQLAL